MKFLTSLVLASGLLLAPGFGLQAAVKKRPAGVVTSVLGRVDYYGIKAKPQSKKKTKVSIKRLRIGQQIYAGDRVKTGNNGRAVMVLSDGTQLKVNYQTDITLKGKNSKGEETERGISAVKILMGRLWARVTKRASRFEFITPAAVAAVKGTTPEFTVDPNGDTCIYLWEGGLVVVNDLGTLNFSKMTQACIKKGFAPPKATKKLTGTSEFDNFEEDNDAALIIEAVDREGQLQELHINYKKK